MLGMMGLDWFWRWGDGLIARVTQAGIGQKGTLEHLKPPPFRLLAINV